MKEKSRKTARQGGGRGTNVADVMVSDVVVIDGEATLIEAAELMREDNVGVLPVIENGKLTGVLTDRDLVIRAIARGADPASTRVAECASRDLVCARPDWSVGDAMEVMADAQVGRLPVIDEEDRIVGIVTLSSLALRSRKQSDALQTAKEVAMRSARAA